jgi:uncharacterized protein (TIGR02611 family)
MSKARTWIFTNLRRTVTFLIGMGLVLTGVVLLALPGPGFVVIILGFAVLSKEFPWAQVALEKTQQQAQRSGRAVRQQWRKRRGVADELPGRRHHTADQQALGG